jgi:hypothetical protein
LALAIFQPSPSVDYYATLLPYYINPCLMKYSLPLSLFFFATQYALAATTGTVPVINPSFEEPTTSTFDTTVTGWVEEHTNIYREAVENASSSSSIPPTNYGTNWLVLTDNSGVYQAIDTFSPDWSYTFSGLMIADRLTKFFGSIQIELWVGNGLTSTGTSLASFATLRDSISFDIEESDSLESRMLEDFTLYTGTADTEGDTVWLRIASTAAVSSQGDSQVYCDNINITAGYQPKTWGGIEVGANGQVSVGHLGSFYVDYEPWIWSYALAKWFYFPDPGANWVGSWVYNPVIQESVEAPQFTPAEGNYETGVSVTISSTTPDAIIRYTTDGSEPSEENGTIYNGPISVSSITEIKAVAYKDELANSAVETALYAFGRVNPAPTQAIVDAGNAAPNIRYYIDGNAYTSGTTVGGWQISHALAVAAGNSSAEAKMLEQIKLSLEGIACVSANGGYPAQHERHITGAYAILKDTPFWNHTLSEDERNKITLLMKAVLVSSAYTTADATYVGNVTTLDGDTNLNRGWNPNYREGMFGGLIHATVFFGGASRVEDMLNDFDHAAFIAELNAAGLTNTYRMFNWAADHPSDGAPTAAQIEANVRNYRYGGKRLKSPMAQLYALTLNTYSGTVSCGLNNGAGILNGDIPTGTIAMGCDSIPNLGARGMLLEFASSDANGPRSSILYSYDGFRPNLTNHIVVLNGGYWMPGPMADTILNRLNVGITDLNYKLEQGYRNYARGVGYTSIFDLNRSGGWNHTFNTTLPLWFDVIKPYHGL